MPANIPPLKRRVPMPKHDTDGLEQYYDYDVRDDSEIKKELKHKRNNKISTAAACISLIILVFGIITGAVSNVLMGIMFVSALVCACFNDDRHIT